MRRIGSYSVWYPEPYQCMWDGPREDGMEPNAPGDAAVLTPREAFALLSRGALLVDLREAYETNYRVFDVPDAFYLPWSRFAEAIGTLPRGRDLVYADAVGIYAAAAARAALAAGIPEPPCGAACMSGGIVEWESDGLPVRKDMEFELGGQCACKMKTRHGGNPLIDKRGSSPKK